MTSAKLNIPLIHIEAGLRSFDRTMPEEINRLLTDAISDFLFCTEQSGVENLRKEGIPDQKIFLVGNVMIDTLLKNKAKADCSPILDKLGISKRDYALLTLHRPSNVDNPDILARIMDALEIIQRDLMVVFPVHPRTRCNLMATPLGDRVQRMPNLKITEPVGYLEFIKLMTDARIILTDSGGVQEESTALQVPCLTLRENTERPVTIECGVNRLVGNDPARVLKAYQEYESSKHEFRMPPLWDGRAAERIVEIIWKNL